MMTSEQSSDIWNETMQTGAPANFTEHTLNGTEAGDRTPGIHLFPDPFPTHKLLWKIIIVFVISGIVILGSFLALFSFSCARRRTPFRRRHHQYRRRQPQSLAFENQLSATADEASEPATPDSSADQVSVHQSCSTSGGLRRWTRDENTARPRSRSNSRSRSLSPGARIGSPPVRSSHDLDDDQIAAGLQRLENARLAFKDDTAKYAEYDSTKERVDIGV